MGLGKSHLCMAACEKLAASSALALAHSSGMYLK
jgi:hypothetical protein